MTAVRDPSLPGSPPAPASPSVPSPLMRRVWPWLATVFRLVLGIVALVAGAAKMSDLAESVRAVRAYQLLPEGLAVLTGTVLPIVEIILGILLVAGLFTRVSAAVFGLLMVVFCFGIGSAWARGLTIDCGCFGGGGQVDPDQTKYLVELLRDFALLAVAAVLVRRPDSRLSLDRGLDLSV